MTLKARLSEEAIHEAFSLLWYLSLERFDLSLDEFQAGMALSRKYGITLYDAAYVELSRKLKCRFVTADKKLYEKVKSMKSVELLR